jgi:hypothetical protein
VRQRRYHSWWERYLLSSLQLLQIYLGDIHFVRTIKNLEKVIHFYEHVSSFNSLECEPWIGKWSGSERGPCAREMGYLICDLAICNIFGMLRLYLKRCTADSLLPTLLRRVADTSVAWNHGFQLHLLLLHYSSVAVYLKHRTHMPSKFPAKGGPMYSSRHWYIIREYY